VVVSRWLKLHVLCSEIVTICDAKFITTKMSTEPLHHDSQARCNVLRVSPHIKLHARHQARHRCSHAFMVMHAADRMMMS
jgi:hypothetical protein